MKWLRHVVVDLAVTSLIVLAVTDVAPWARWFVWVYTPFMILLRTVALVAGGLMPVTRRPQDAPPSWFFHVLFAVNTVVLLAATWWIEGTGWALIWGLSFAAEARTRRPTLARA